MSKPAKRDDVKTLLLSKLEFEPLKPGKHEGIALPSYLNIRLPLTLPINLQHGRGDVAAHIVRQIHTTLGISHSDFVEGHQCHVSALTIYATMLAYQSSRLISLLQRDPPAYAPLFSDYCKSATLALPDLRASFPLRKVTSNDRRLAADGKALMGKLGPLVGAVAPDLLRTFTDFELKLCALCDTIAV